MTIKPVHVAMYRFWKSFGEKKRCMSCDRILPKKFGLINVDHLLEKSNIKYRKVECDEDYMFLVCSKCHNMRNEGFPTEKHKKAIKDAEERFKSRV